MNRRLLAAALVFMIGTGTAASADQVVLRSGSSVRGTIANRAQILRAPALVTAIELHPEMPGVDAASVRALIFARDEVDFVVLEDGRLETVIPLGGAGPSSPRTTALQRAWLAITVSYSGYAMADLNDLLAISSSQPGPLTSLHGIGHGLGFGMELGVDMPNRFAAGLAWDRLGASSGTEDPDGGSFSVSAFLLRAFGSYALARSDRSSLRLGVSLGAVVPSVILDQNNPALADFRDRVVGVAPAGEVFGGGEYQWSRWLGVSLDAGYRRAVSKDVPITTLDLRDLDYSGWFVRAGLRFSAPE